MAEMDREALKAIARDAIARGGSSKEQALVIGITEAYRAGYEKAYKEIKERIKNGRERKETAD